MNWSEGFSSRYYAMIVDPITWRDVAELDIISGSVNIEDNMMIESANLEVLNYDSSVERWIRIYLDARQNGSNYHGAIFTGLATSPSISIEGYTVKNSLTCYSVLKPADDILLPKGYYVPSGINGGNMVRDLLESVPAPITIEDDAPILSRTLIAEDGETYLSMATKLLYAMGWRFRIEGDGTIFICSSASDYSAVFDSIDSDSIEMTVNIENDWYSCPNIFRAIAGGITAVARDDSPDSPLSTVNRGREIWMEETSCYLSENETVAEYAERRLREEQMQYYTLSYSRRFHPDVRTSDLIRIHYPAQRIDGIFYVSNQNISLGYGATVSETAQKI